MMVWVMSLHTIFGARMRCGGRDVPKFLAHFHKLYFLCIWRWGVTPARIFGTFSPTVSLVYFFTNANALHSELLFRLNIYVLLPSSNIFANLPFLLTFNEKMHFFSLETVPNVWYHHHTIVISWINWFMCIMLYWPFFVILWGLTRRAITLFQHWQHSHGCKQYHDSEGLKHCRHHFLFFVKVPS